MKDIHTENLRLAGWLSGLPEHLQSVILDVGIWHDFEPGDTVYTSGGDGNTIWGIGSGTVKMFISAGEERLRFCHLVGAGYWFGELELLLDMQRIVEMKIAEPARLLRLRVKDLRTIASRHPEVWLAVARLAATNEALAVAAADDLMLRDPKKRLAATLLRVTGQRWGFQNTPALKSAPVTNLELSEAANLSRSVTAKIMSDFASEGTVSKGYKTVRVLRPDRLSGLL
ncbi:Crp/Fnr family transcriptional regulator [Shimia sp. SDUM112013]|uniref:Crp/Fnr family transcriptional regulator n=1 Tax=Shimia sp. SDUM112013 TaxID=3136160 RepID=UPI0032ECE9A1